MCELNETKSANEVQSSVELSNRSYHFNMYILVLVVVVTVTGDASAIDVG